ncbi:MAG TPA: hypothetical protein VFM45_02860, partial [Anaeromyxobacteraceae bacterium]|nr:hypothetical protein [Anaeromyxobacteraceae bacterium]
MSRPLPGSAMLAAVLAPVRARALLSRHPGADAAGVEELLALPGDGRLAALAAFVERSAADAPPEPASRSGEETKVRVPVASEPSGAGDRPGEAPAWPMLGEGSVLPFDLAPTAPALAQVDAGLLELGARVAQVAASGIASVVGGEVSVDGRLLPGVTAPAGAALVPVDLTAIAGVATLAVERSFAARLAARVADAPFPPGLPSTLSPAERAVVELAVLGA